MVNGLPPNYPKYFTNLALLIYNFVNVNVNPTLMN
jgi:hypothetical protein